MSGSRVETVDLTVEPSAKRRCKRKKVAASTVTTVPMEVWLVVCKNVFFSPHMPFRLMMASKQIWLTLRDDKEWWKEFYVRVVKYQDILLTSRFYSSLISFAKKDQCHRTILKLVFSPRCSSCGVRFGHTVFRPMMQRLCRTCVRDKLISNKVLYYRHGIYFADFIAAYVEKGGFLLQCDFTRPNVGALSKYTTEQMDLVGRQSVPKGRWLDSALIFFKREDIARILGLDLERAAVAARKRDEAIRLLQAVCERRLMAHRLLRGKLCVSTGADGERRVVTNWFKCLGGPVEERRKATTIQLRQAEELSEGEFLRREGMKLRSIVRTSWLAGGAYYAIANTDGISGRMLKYRPGFGADANNVFSKSIQDKAHHVRL